MTITTIEIVKLTPSEGYILTNGTIYREEVYLTQPASIEDWREVDELPPEPIETKNDYIADEKTPAQDTGENDETDENAEQ